jgi:tripartite-type tricarboxylate transporter receptor subunit TctC
VLVVNPKLPVHSVKELIAYTRKNPDKVLYATAGVGTPPHLTLARFNKAAGVNIIGVPYKGAAQSLLDVVAGREQVYSGAFGTVVPFVKSGKLRALAVLDKHRSKVLPDVPTIAEAGLPGVEVNAWYGLLAPKGTPREIVDKIAKAVAQAVVTPEVEQTLKKLGNSPVTDMGPDKFAAFLKSDFPKWADAVKAAGAKAN